MAISYKISLTVVLKPFEFSSLLILEGIQNEIGSIDFYQNLGIFISCLKQTLKHFSNDKDIFLGGVGALKVTKALDLVHFSIYFPRGLNVSRCNVSLLAYLDDFTSDIYDEAIFIIQTNSMFPFFLRGPLSITKIELNTQNM